MSKCDCTTVWIQLLINIDSKILTNCYRLSCECFVCLDDIELGYITHTSLSHSLLSSCYRSDTHYLRTNTCKCASYESSHRLNTKLLSLLFAHNNDCCCTVVNSGSITSGYESAWVDWTKLSKALNGNAGSWALVGIENHGFFLLLDFYRNNFILECAGCDCCLSLVLALSCELI